MEKKETRYRDFIVDYKQLVTLGRYLDMGKIMPARLSKKTLRQQKMISRAIKKARNLALLPNGMRASDDFGRRAKIISPKPFDF